MPFFSVIITTYNREKILPKAIDSVLNQSFTDYECIVVNDGSIDGTRNILNYYNKKSKVKVINLEKNGGLSKARNVGAENAKGRFVCFLDDDDVFLKNRLRYQAEQIEKDNCVIQMYYCGVRQIDANGIIDLIPDSKGGIWNLLIRGWTPPVSAQCISLEAIKKVGLFDTGLKSCIDHDIWMKLGRQGYSVNYIAEALVMPYVNTYDIRRMTNIVDERIVGVKQFMKKWKLDITEKEGGKKFNRFFRQYLSREYYRFSRKQLFSNKFFKSVYYFLLGVINDPRNYKKIKKILKQYLKYIASNRKLIVENKNKTLDNYNMHNENDSYKKVAMHFGLKL